MNQSNFSIVAEPIYTLKGQPIIIKVVCEFRESDEFLDSAITPECFKVSSTVPLKLHTYWEVGHNYQYRIPCVPTSTVGCKRRILYLSIDNLENRQEQAIDIKLSNSLLSSNYSFAGREIPIPKDQRQSGHGPDCAVALANIPIGFQHSTLEQQTVRARRIEALLLEPSISVENQEFARSVLNHYTDSSLDDSAIIAVSHRNYTYFHDALISIKHSQDHNKLLRIALLRIAVQSLPNNFFTVENEIDFEKIVCETSEFEFRKFLAIANPHIRSYIMLFRWKSMTPSERDKVLTDLQNFQYPMVSTFASEIFRDLNHPKFSTREAAEKKLLDMGEASSSYVTDFLRRIDLTYDCRNRLEILGRKVRDLPVEPRFWNLYKMRLMSAVRSKNHPAIVDQIFDSLSKGDQMIFINREAKEYLDAIKNSRSK